jgi:activator of 2-hydroxyglutaryl-CoA dehydratase
MIPVGIDSGSATMKAVLVNCNHITAQVVLPTAFDFLSVSEEAHKNVLADLELPKKM